MGTLQDEFPADLAHDPAQLQQTANELHRLTTCLLSLSMDAVLQAAVREQSQAGVEALDLGARRALVSLLDDRQATRAQDLHENEDCLSERQLDRQLAAGLARARSGQVDAGAVERHNAESLASRGCDLARTMATALFNLGQTPEVRLKNLVRSVRDKESLLMRAMDEVARRFELTESETGEYLQKVCASQGAPIAGGITEGRCGDTREDW